MPDDSSAPVHAVELRISIGANNWKYAHEVLVELTERIASLEANAGIASGGWNGSFLVTVATRDITPDQYRAELEEWAQRGEGARPLITGK